MTARSYKAIRVGLVLTQGELAAELGVATNTVSRRELGLLPIPREAELALRHVATRRACGA